MVADSCQHEGVGHTILNSVCRLRRLILDVTYEFMNAK